MLETQGRVMAVEAGYAWVESTRQGGCGSCSAKGGCGSHLLGEALVPAASTQIRVKDALGVQIGDTVLLGMPEDGALRAAFLLYGLPVLGLLLGLLLAQPWGDLWALIAGVTGLSLALWGVRVLAPKRERALDATEPFQPLILACLSSAPKGVSGLVAKTIPIKPLS